MEEKDTIAFYLTWILLITGFSFLLFTLFLELADGIENELFGWIGGITFTLGLLTGAGNLVRKANRKNKDH